MASEVARYMSGQKKEHQKSASKYFSSTKRKEFQINTSVLVRTKRQTFYKHSSIFFPAFEKDIYVITHIDKKTLPWAYTVKNVNNNMIRYLYSFEMKKIATESTETLNETPLTIKQDKIKVHDIVIKQKSKLRSGRIIPDKNIVFYRITIDNRQDIVPLDALKLLARSLGDTTIEYGPFFAIPGNEKYRIDT